jgi:3'-phosphoadenosine 5'-phosphosulfate sulfotransferase (PAPS reductase)/FAD synthetase
MAQDFVMDGPEFVRRFLSIKNLILNVSGVLWRREALLAALEATEADHAQMKVACDWKIYAHAALNGGKVGFVARPLNMHRRHAQSVTQARDAAAHYAEIIEVQDHIADQLPLDTATLARREVYRAELRKQFGL